MSELVHNNDITFAKKTPDLSAGGYSDYKGLYLILKI